MAARLSQPALESDRLASARTVGALSAPAQVLEADTFCQDLERIFADDRSLSSVVVHCHDGRDRLLDRAAFEYEMYGGRGFGRWILEATPIEGFAKASDTLTLDVATPIRTAFEALLHRDRLQRFHDILVVSRQGKRTIPMRLHAADLLEAVARQHQHDATHDALTSLANRAQLVEHLQLRTAREEPTALLFIDLDRFKVINDSLGHPAGDALLAQFAERLRRSVRTSDLTARLGGDEFAVVLRDHGEDAQALAQRLLQSLRTPFPLGDASVMVSIGIARAEPDDDAAELLRKADVAMYEAKGTGGNSYHDFHGDLVRAAEERLDVEMALQRALADGTGLTLCYQPVVELGSDRLLGFEALVRGTWDDRLWMPDAFLPIAEETGLIEQIDRWVMDTAARQLAIWRREFHLPQLRMSVNVSPRDLEGAGFFDHVEALLVSSGLDAGALVFELTEGSLMRRITEALPALEHLRDLGAWFAIDDFGTGYSSLHQLSKLPVDVLKVDRSFVIAAESSPQEAAIVKLIVALAQAMRVHVIAEGVETQEQALLLSSLGCRYAQGYYFAAPLTVADAEAWLARRPRGAHRRLTAARHML